MLRKKSRGSVGLVYEGSILVESFSEFEIPVKLKTGMQVGAISLGFYYPEQYFDIIGAQLINGVTGFSWTAADGLFRMGWCDMNSLNIKDDDVVVILKLRAKDLSGLTTSIELNIFEDCEFADALAIPKDYAVVSIPEINTSLTAIRLDNSLTGLSVYPNPVTGNSSIEFSLEKPGNIRLALIDIVGNHILDIASGDFSSGIIKLRYMHQV